MKRNKIQEGAEIKIKLLSATDILGTRIKIIDSINSVIIPYNYQISNPIQQSCNYLINLGFNPIVWIEQEKHDTIICEQTELTLK